MCSYPAYTTADRIEANLTPGFSPHPGDGCNPSPPWTLTGDEATNRRSAMRRLMALALALAPAFTTPTAAQQPRANVGTLTCTLSSTGEKQTTPPSEERTMRCGFKPMHSGVEMTYSGIIRKVGDGGDLYGKLVLIWVVEAPLDTKIEPGLLAQTYVGRPSVGDAKGAAGAGLVGERNADIIMKPETAVGTPAPGPVVTVMELKVASVPT
jgi:hypothetical protein